MDELPTAIQNEIWDYVRGNRAYWKQQFRPILSIIKFIDAELWDDVRAVGEATVFVGRWTITLSWPMWYLVEVWEQTVDHFTKRVISRKSFSNDRAATKELYSQIEIAILKFIPESKSQILKTFWERIRNHNERTSIRNSK